MLKDIDPSKFEYEKYTNQYFAPISEQSAREKMTNYHYINCNPLLIRTVDEKHYMPGPDEDTNPIKRKFYNCVQWYHDLYDGRYGQRTDVNIKTVDLSRPDLQNLIVAMAVSHDYTLQEALYAVAHACCRCRMALMHKYAPELGGYSETSDEYYNQESRCDFCKGDNLKRRPNEVKSTALPYQESIAASVQDINRNMVLDGMVQSPIMNLQSSIMQNLAQQTCCESNCGTIFVVGEDGRVTQLNPIKSSIQVKDGAQNV